MDFKWGELVFDTEGKMLRHAAREYMSGGGAWAAPDLADFTEADAGEVADEAIEAGWFGETVYRDDIVAAFAGLFQAARLAKL